jgi:hypothetical protein
MDHPGDIGETLAWTRGQRLFGPLCGGMTEELRHRLALDSGRSPDLLIKFGIKPKASHIRTVSHLCLHVIQIGMAVRGISGPVEHGARWGKGGRSRDEPDEARSLRLALLRRRDRARVETLSGVSAVPMPAAAPDGTGGTEPWPVVLEPPISCRLRQPGHA